MQFAPAFVTSTANSRVRLLRSLAERKHRVEHGMFLAEGIRLAEEAIDAGIRPSIVLSAPEQTASHERARRAVAALAACADHALEATPEVVASASDAQHGQGLLFAVPFSELPVYDPRHADTAASRRPARGTVTAEPLALVVDSVADPGNVGSLLRTARAAGWNPLLTTGADPYAPKAMRAGAGAQFWLGRLQTHDISSLTGICSRFQQVLVAAADGDLAYDRVDWRLPTVLIVGGEAHGPRAVTRQLATGSVRIPMLGGESLNVAAAAAVLCFEAARQRAR